MKYLVIIKQSASIMSRISTVTMAVNYANKCKIATVYSDTSLDGQTSVTLDSSISYIRKSVDS